MRKYCNKNIKQTKQTLTHLYNAIPPVVDTCPFVFKQETLTSNDDPYIWEYPVATELIQYNLHKCLPVGANFDAKRNVVNTYVGVPWGRFDAVKCFFPINLIASLKDKIQTLKNIAVNNNVVYKVHTTTHKENWWKWIPLLEEIGVTNVHSCHYDHYYTPEFNPFGAKKLTFHCLPLHATNAELKDRNKNLKYIALKKRKYLATFKGAHMPHYKSDVRLLLQNVYNNTVDKSNIYVQVSNTWFYNKEIFPHYYKLTPKQLQKEKQQQQVNNVHYNNLVSHSIFTLCPEGGGINTIRLWEALSVGSIPVLIVSNAHLPMLLSIHPNLHKCCYIVFRCNINNIFNILKQKAVDLNTIQYMSNMCIEVYNDVRCRNTFDNQYSSTNTVFSTIL